MRAPRRLTFDTRGSQLDSWSLDSQAILYESNRNGRFEIFKQGLDDAVPETMLSSAGRAYGVRPSPDGAWMLYWEQEFAAPGGPPHPMRLMRRPPAGGPREKVLEEPFDDFLDFRCPAKSGGCVLSGRGAGKEMVFSSIDPVRGKGERIAGIELKTGLHAGATAAVDWSVSPDGSQLALVDAQPLIHLFSRPEGAWREIPVEPGWGRLNAISWAADGGGFYAVSRLEGKSNLLHVSASGRAVPLLGKGLD